ncbi:unnamed protein product [Dovyalis caffra]|uniref:Uncharacterized protein n=1 Tax=Dovyalis caffra TaxID=77055 RepID=A0AAV1R968_9ROSI|nr:unnamed protein product [Dovyalis caffra]
MCPFLAVSYGTFSVSCIALNGPLYDFTAYTECKAAAEKPLYNGGIFKDQAPLTQHRTSDSSDGYYIPALILHNLTQGTMYCFSSE